MSKQKLTPWFPADVEPVRRGYYQKRGSMGGIAKRFWDGISWRMPCLCCYDPLIAPWRGLAKKP